MKSISYKTNIGVPTSQEHVDVKYFRLDECGGLEMNKVNKAINKLVNTCNEWSNEVVSLGARISKWVVFKCTRQDINEVQYEDRGMPLSIGYFKYTWS